MTFPVMCLVYLATLSSLKLPVKASVVGGVIQSNGQVMFLEEDVVRGLSIKTLQLSVDEEFHSTSANFTDYVGLAQNWSLDSSPLFQEKTNVIVELCVVCDMELSALFNNDPNEILRYWQAYLWDLNMRFKTLSSNHITFRLTSILFSTDLRMQPYIEGARNANGDIHFPKMLDLFSRWIYLIDLINYIPKFDVALATTAAYSADGIAGIAYLGRACSVDIIQGRRFGVAVGIDRGSFNVLLVAHELGHVLGAPHDADIEGCTERGFIMSSASSETQYFFSSCSNHDIGNFVRSNRAFCFRYNASPSSIYIPDDAAPSLDEQCKRYAYKNATVPKDFLDKCVRIKCQWKDLNGQVVTVKFDAVDNSRCLGGRCFRGKCVRSTT